MAAEAQPMKVGVIPSVTPFIVCHLPPLISAFYHAHFAPPTTRYVTMVHRPLTQFGHPFVYGAPLVNSSLSQEG